MLGTRPEAIKLAPVILELKKDSTFETRCISTGQHPVSIYEIFDLFGLEIDHDLAIFEHNSKLSGIFSKASSALSAHFESEKYDWIIVQGDTSSGLAAALSAFYSGIKVAHIEAGLRTENSLSPFPEEMNRRLIDQISQLRFAATIRAEQNLISEGFPRESIFTTGNTVVDALRIISQNLIDENKDFSNDSRSLKKKNKYILVTLHRRESWGSKIVEVLNAINEISETTSDLEVRFVLHPNLNLQELIRSNLKSCEKITLLPPQGYREMIHQLKNAWLLLTDSGGLQEEAPYFRVPVLVAREETERPEGIESGCSILTGTDGFKIKGEVNRLLNDDKAYNSMTNANLLYGDGWASKRITETLKAFRMMA